MSYILILEENIPWHDYVTKGDYRVRVVINKNLRGGYNVSSADSSVLKITPNRYLSFVHPARFMGVADTLPLAVQAAALRITKKSCV